jgi:NAD(P)H-hydrate epimerase
VSGWLKKIVMALNERARTVIAIDMPSGLFTEDNAANDPYAIVHATYTLSLELPKLAFFLADNARYVGQWQVLPIGLDRPFIATLKAEAELIGTADVAPLLPLRDKFSHKGDFGHAWLLAGGKGKIGAALLAAKGCLRSGAGLLSVHVPAGMDLLVHGSLPEAMVSSDPGTDALSSLPKFEKCSAIGIGPGIGTADATARLLKLLIQEAPAPLVIDADALNILSDNRTWLSFLPKGTILTPHPKEFERLTEKFTDGHARLMAAKAFAVRHAVVLVLKGAYTAICAPDGRIYFNNTGNPGMAKGGSGDALTGIITGLRAQGLDPLSAALVGVHAHGIAGDLAAKKLGMDGMLVSELIGHLPQAWQKLRGIRSPDQSCCRSQQIPAATPSGSTHGFLSWSNVLQPLRDQRPCCCRASTPKGRRGSSRS